MERNELISAIKQIAGRKLTFPEEYNKLPEIGEAGHVSGITSKYVLLSSKCYIKPVWEDGEDRYVNVIRRIPVCGTLYGEISNKVAIDTLCTKDLENLYNGLTGFISWATVRMVEIRKQAAEYQRYADKYKVLEKINAKKLG